MCAYTDVKVTEARLVAEVIGDELLKEPSFFRFMAGVAANRCEQSLQGRVPFQGAG